jgi:predicted DNA-binding antitoxin AbrB/MazE fold protein
MNTITVSAIYRHGVFEPQKPINMAENAEVLLQITVLDQKLGKPGSAFGALPELAAITDEDLEEVKKIWDEMADEQIRKLTES